MVPKIPLLTQTRMSACSCLFCVRCKLRLTSRLSFYPLLFNNGISRYHAYHSLHLCCSTTAYLSSRLTIGFTFICIFGHDYRNDNSPGGPSRRERTATRVNRQHGQVDAENQYDMNDTGTKKAPEYSVSQAMVSAVCVLCTIHLIS
jgi:hypothetical protein